MSNSSLCSCSNDEDTVWGTRRGMITLNIDTHRNVLLLPLTPVCTQQSRTRPRDLIKGKVLLLSRKHNSGPLFYSFKPQDEKLYLYINCSNEGFVIQTRIS